MNLTVDVDASALLAALDRLGVEAERICQEASKVTANKIVNEAKKRVARATGETQRAIVSEQAPGPLGGYRVFVGTTSHPANLPQWLEWGTKHMSARPFLFSSARLEEGPHRQRIAAAVQDAIDAQGLGS